MRKTNFTKGPKSKYKLNVHKGGVILADNIFQLMYRLIFKKYVVTSNRRGKGSRRSYKVSK